MAITLQIYTMQTVQEARALAAVGIERIGVTPAERGLPGEVSVEAAADIGTIRHRGHTDGKGSGNFCHN